MKFYLLVISIAICSYANAKNYYFSSSSGNDSRTPEEAQHPNTPWKTLNKLNSFFNNLNAGDSVLLKRGDVFYGAIIVNKSGSVNSPIVISAYDQGSLPVISGFATLSHWSSKQKGIYESLDMLNDSLLNMVTINDAEYPMGRYPNSNTNDKGWLKVSSHVNNTSITDASLATNIDWTGGQAVIRKKRYVIDRNTITSRSNNTLNYTSGTHYLPADGFGYFIQNHIATLDQFGEWYFDPISKKLSVYFGEKKPSSYKIAASNISTLISVRKQENIVFDNLSLEGSNDKGFHLYNSQNIFINKCVISFSGVDAIDGFNSRSIRIENCRITNSNNNGMDLTGGCNSFQVKNNIIKNTGLYAGMARNSGFSFTGINIGGDNNLVANNEIDSSGYVGIRFDGNSINIKNNFINHFCFLKDDGGGIYTGNSDPKNPRQAQLIEGNIVLNGTGANDGATGTNSQAYGIYVDDNSANIQVIGNTVAYSGRAGIIIHNSHDIRVKNNICYGNSTQFIMQKDAASEGLIRNNSITDNIFFSKDPSQFVASFITSANDINLFGKIDSNYYSRPLDDNATITTSYVDNSLGKMNKYYDLTGWKAHYKQDMTSKRSPFEIKSYKFDNTHSSNKIPNGDFDNNSQGAQGLKCKAEWKPSGLFDNGYLQVTSPPDNPNSYITIPIGTINSGKNYLLKFSVRGTDDSDKAISVFLRKSDAPYTNLAQTKYRKISNERRNYEIMFSASKDEQTAFLVFSINDANTTYGLDNVGLYEVNAAVTKPEDNILFEYNASRSDKKVALNGTYTDINNKPYSNSITLQPYSSVILMKQN